MSVVVSFRIPKKLKEVLDRSGVDWRRMVREYLELLALQEAKKEILSEAEALRRDVGKLTTESWRIIRESRDEQ